MAEIPLHERRLPDHRLEALRILGRKVMVKAEGNRFHELWKSKSIAKTLEEISYLSEEKEGDESTREIENEDIISAFENHMNKLNNTDFGSLFTDALGPIPEESGKKIRKRLEKITGREYKPSDSQSDASEAASRLFEESVGKRDLPLMRSASTFVRMHMEKFDKKERNPLKYLAEKLDWAIGELEGPR